jgi:hypothetical protein
MKVTRRRKTVRKTHQDHLQRRRTRSKNRTHQMRKTKRRIVRLNHPRRRQ